MTRSGGGEGVVLRKAETKEVEIGVDEEEVAMVSKDETQVI